MSIAGGKAGDANGSEDPGSKDPGRSPLEAKTPATDATLPAPSSLPIGEAMAPTLPPARSEPSAKVTLPGAADRGEDLAKLPRVDSSFYALGAELARGGMGRIRYARDRRVGRPVAIKELLSSRPVAVARFLREATLTARLQHPGIVPVYEAGRWDDGAPFIAMKLVEGRPFDKVIAGAKSARDRIGLLPNLIAVAEAVAYAHSRGVIHRDLKPANILVGKYGETVIIDWGLGKKIGAAEAADLAVSVETPPDSDLTMAGATMGTPAYMAPQQAAGAEVDERTDVYALGAILYHLLAGHEPYRDAQPGDADEAIAMVQSGPPRALAELAADAPEELLAVADKAMARRLVDRYATAGELAEDLRRFQTGQLVGAHEYSPWQLVKRWVARRRAAVGVATVAILVLLVLGAVSVQRIRSERSHAETQEHIAIAEKSAADQSRGEVEELLTFMLVDLRDKLDRVGKLELLDMVASKANDYYGRQTRDETPATAAKRALALHNLASVFRSRANLEEAWRTNDAALAIRRKLAAEHPHDRAHSIPLAYSLLAQGDLLLARGDATGAEALYREYQEIYRALVELDPTDTAALHGLATSHERLATILRAGNDLDAALQRYDEAIAILRRIRSPQDDKPSSTWPRSLAAALSASGTILTTRGDHAGALARFREAATLLGPRSDRETPARRRDRAIILTSIGDIYLATGELAAARVPFSTAMSIYAQLVELDPSNAMWQRELAATHTKLAVLLQVEGNVDGAIAMQRKALAVREQLLAGNPTNLLAQSDVANSCVLIASAMTSSGRADAARPLARRAAELYATSANDPAALYNAVCAYALAGDKDRAFAMLDKCLAGGYGDRAALESDPDMATLRKDPRWRPMIDRIANSHGKHGD